MASDSDDRTKKPRPESDHDAGTTVSVDVADIPDARPDTVDASAEKSSSSRDSDSSSRDSDSSSSHLPELPAADEPAAREAHPAPGASGSVEVKLSSPDLSGAIPSAVTGVESQPVPGSGRVVAPVAPSGEGTGPVSAGRSRRITGLVQDAVSAGVERLGSGIESVGEGVSKVGDLTKKVPLVGASVGKLGEGLAKAGESIHALPRVAQTRRGRLLVRSVVVGFLLVFSWITVIVGFQLRAHDTPDFRPAAEQILVQISQGDGSIGEVYERSSPRFQEVVRKERFVDDMLDLNATNGKFREITAINETLVTTGPTGEVGRVSLTASYEKGIAHGSISFHYDKGQWKLLGIGIEVPRDVHITQVEREKRVAACLDAKGHDVSDQRAKCDVRDAAETLLEKVRDGHAGDVWDQASDIFKQQETRTRFIEIQDEQRAELGNYRRIINVTEARAIGGITAEFDALAEFDKSSGVRVDFAFARPSKNDPWQLRRFKVVVPMPRADEDLRPAAVPPMPDTDTHDMPPGPLPPPPTGPR